MSRASCEAGAVERGSGRGAGRGSLDARDEILDQVWGISYETGTNVLDVLLHGLRRKLARHGLKDVIQTVRGVGYRLVEPGTSESLLEHA